MHLGHLCVNPGRRPEWFVGSRAVVEGRGRNAGPFPSHEVREGGTREYALDHDTSSSAFRHTRWQAAAVRFR